MVQNVSQKLSEEIASKIRKGKTKGAVAEVILRDDVVLVVVVGSNRPLGRYAFFKKGDSLEFKSRQTIEREFFPFEVALEALQKWAKRHQIKQISW